jgi:hypothetical protein
LKQTQQATTASYEALAEEEHPNFATFYSDASDVEESFGLRPTKAVGKASNIFVFSLIFSSK